MKKTVRQIVKQLAQEPQEILKTASDQISGQGEKPASAQAKTQDVAFETSQKRISQLRDQDQKRSGEKVEKIREELGIYAPSEKIQGTKPPPREATQPKAPAIPTEFEKSLEQQIEALRKKKEAEEARRKTVLEEERLRREKEAEEKEKAQFQTPASPPRQGAAPWLTKIKSAQGPGETRPSFGKQ